MIKLYLADAIKRFPNHYILHLMYHNSGFYLNGEAKGLITSLTRINLQKCKAGPHNKGVNELHELYFLFEFLIFFLKLATMRQLISGES